MSVGARETEPFPNATRDPSGDQFTKTTETATKRKEAASFLAAATHADTTRTCVVKPGSWRSAPSVALAVTLGKSAKRGFASLVWPDFDHAREHSRFEQCGYQNS